MPSDACILYLPNGPLLALGPCRITLTLVPHPCMSCISEVIRHQDILNLSFTTATIILEYELLHSAVQTDYTNLYFKIVTFRRQIGTVPTVFNTPIVPNRLHLDVPRNTTKDLGCLLLRRSSNWVGVRDNAGMRPLVISTADQLTLANEQRGDSARVGVSCLRQMSEVGQ